MEIPNIVKELKPLQYQCQNSHLSLIYSIVSIDLHHLQKVLLKCVFYMITYETRRGEDVTCTATAFKVTVTRSVTAWLL